jgi:hypothetical protein
MTSIARPPSRVPTVLLPADPLLRKRVEAGLATHSHKLFELLAGKKRAAYDMLDGRPVNFDHVMVARRMLVEGLTRLGGGAVDRFVRSPFLLAGAALHATAAVIDRRAEAKAQTNVDHSGSIKPSDALNLYVLGK